MIAQLGVLGIHLDVEANEANGAGTGGRISTPGGPVALVVATDEELLIARDTADLT